MNQILDTILKDTYTILQLKHRLRVLRTYLTSQLFISPIPIDQPDLTWLSSLGEGFFKQFNKDNVQQILTELDGQTDKLTTIIMYVPFEVNDANAAQIGQALRRLWGEHVMLDGKFDPDLIAGCALVWNGIYQDYSLRKKIADNKQQVLDVIKEYLR